MNMRQPATLLAFATILIVAGFATFLRFANEPANTNLLVTRNKSERANTFERSPFPEPVASRLPEPEPDSSHHSRTREEILIGGDKFIVEISANARQIFFTSGEPYADMPLVDGLQHGTSRCWYQNGVLHAVEEYVAGVREGSATYWSQSGQRIAEGSYFHGYQDGTWTTWYENGLKESEGFYDTQRTWEDGVGAQRQNGTWSYWLPDGNLDLERSGVYEHGKLISK